MREEHNRIVTIPFSRLDEIDTIAIGEKAQNLGVLTSLRLPVPNGFVVTSFAFDYFLSTTNLDELVRKELASADVSNSSSLESASKKIRNAILRTDISDQLKKAIQKSYGAVSGFTDSYVAVRSSKIRLEESYEGKFETYLNVRGKDDVVEKVKLCWASVFSPGNLFYLLSKGETDFRIGVIVQKMIQAEVSGIMFTKNPIDDDEKKISVECVLGLGEALIKGDLSPDTYLVDKESGEVVEKKIVPQEWMLVRKGRTKKGEDPNVKVKVGEVWRVRQKLEQKYIQDLVKIGKSIEEAFGGAQEIEWTYEGGRIWIVQTRPMKKIQMPENTWKKTSTYAALKAKIGLEEESAESEKKEELKVKASVGAQSEEKKEKKKAVVKGVTKNSGLVSGLAKVVSDPVQLKNISDPTIVVVKVVTSAFEGKMKNVVGIVCEEGSTDSYETILARSLDIPCVCEAESARNLIVDGEAITVDGLKGEVVKGETQEGKSNAQEIIKRQKEIEKEKKAKEISSMREEIKQKSFKMKKEKKDKVKTATKVFVDIENPDEIEKLGQYHIDGIGCVNAAKIIKKGGVHPGSAIKDTNVKNDFVNNIVLHTYKVALMFEKEPVIYQLSDLSSKEYADLSGGEKFEVVESNPKIGLRGASRFIANPIELELELEALKVLRNKENLKNISIAIPFVRSFSEIKEVKKQISAFGFRRSSTFHLYCTVEVPSCAVRVEKILELGLDGVLINLDALKQNLFAIDEANPKMMLRVKEKHPAVLKLVEQVVKACNKKKVRSQVMIKKGEDELIKKLIEFGVTSISTKVDQVRETRKLIAEEEGGILKRKKR